uniref:Uncharacterized protein n=1 Tax=viral metagenome TaxID=1070528 RepID=A0A6M3JI80_9ZZZZ
MDNPYNDKIIDKAKLGESIKEIYMAMDSIYRQLASISQKQNDLEQIYRNLPKEK